MLEHLDKMESQEHLALLENQEHQAIMELQVLMVYLDYLE